MITTRGDLSDTAIDLLTLDVAVRAETRRHPDEIAAMAAMGFELITLFGEPQYRRWLGRPRRAVRLYIGAMGGWVVGGLKFPTPEAAAAFAILHFADQ